MKRVPLIIGAVIFCWSTMAFALVFPDPKPTVNPKPFGDVEKSPVAKRNFLKAFTRAYIRTYSTAFLEQNKLKDDRFGSDFMEMSLALIDNMPDEEIMKMDDQSYRVIKGAMDEVARDLYWDYLPELKPSDVRGEVARMMKNGERKLEFILVSLDKKVVGLNEATNARVAELEKKLVERIEKLEASQVAPAGASTSVSSASSELSKKDRLILFGAVGLSLLSLFATLVSRRS